jgi:Leucine-rich repeat (LRR) protein
MSTFDDISQLSFVCYHGRSDRFKLELNNKDIEVIAKFNNLKVLEIRSCIISEIPNIKQLNNIEDLRIINNDDLTTLPDSLGELYNLKKLTISDNYELKELPDNIGQLKNLEELDLHTNINLTTLPTTLGNLKNLKIFDLSYNSNFEKLPESIFQIKNLEKLYLNENNLESIPDSICGLSNLKNLYLDENQLKELPDCIGELKNLEILDLATNNLESIPDTIGNLSNLKYLVIRENNLRKFPKNIETLTNLATISLSDNKIDDFLPDSLNQLPKLKQIYLDDNINIKGKTLINDSLNEEDSECQYSDDYDLCMTKDIKCLHQNSDGYNFKPCTDNNKEEENKEDIDDNKENNTTKKDLHTLEEDCKKFKDYVSETEESLRNSYCNVNKKETGIECFISCDLYEEQDKVEKIYEYISFLQL